MRKFSIIIPLYNKAPYIKDTMKSVLNQTYDDYEVIIIDDGSTDNGGEIIKVNYLSDKVRLIQQNNKGPSSARNRGIIEAKGEWILFLDADDMLMPYALERFCRAISNYPFAKYIVGNFFLMTNKDHIKIGSKCRINRRLSNAFHAEATRLLTGTSGSTILAKEILKEDFFDEHLRRYEDAELHYRLMRKYPVYMFSTPVSIINREAAAASFPRKNPEEDFVCHLDFRNKKYWEKMTLFLLARDCKRNYPRIYKTLYADINKKIDLIIGFLYIRLLNLLFTVWNTYFANIKTYKLELLLNSEQEIE